MLLKDIYQNTKETLREGGVETPALDARVIIEERTGYDWSDIVANGEELLVTDVLCQEIYDDVTERTKGKPLSRIYNKREFWGLNFSLSSDTLDPRPDTELIIELAIKKFKDRKAPKTILDLGTGSGCILISLLTEFPDARGIGVDISKGALETAHYNAQQNGCGERCTFVQGSWWDALETGYDAQDGAHSVQQKFDLIVSNPPYITNQVISSLSPEVKNHDPILSLDGGLDGLDAYKIIFSQLNDRLFDDGIALLEIGYDQENDVMRLSKESRFALRTVHVDLAGNPRVVDISCGDKRKKTIDTP